MKLLSTVTLIVLAIALTACASTQKNSLTGEPAQTLSDYRDTIEKNTRFFRKYDGFYESFRAYATYLTPEVRNAMLTRRSEFLEWDSRMFQLERDRSNQEMATQTQFFLQFYTPNSEYDDLAKNNTIWNIYLEIDGRKFQGKVKKGRNKRVDYQALFRNFDGFSTPYEVTFPVSTTDAIRHKTKLVMASSVGEAEFLFEPTE